MLHTLTQSLRIHWLVLIFCAHGLSIADIKPTTPTLLVLGDSLSAGYGIELKQSWVNLLQHRLTEQQYDYLVVNGSVSGNTTADAYHRLPALIKQHKPSLIIIALGGNDGLRGYPIGIMRKNLASIIDMAKNAGAQPLLVQMQIPPNYGKRYSQQFTETYHSLSREKNIITLPFFLARVATEASLMQADGIHPNALAQPQILDALWPSLQTQL